MTELTAKQWDKVHARGDYDFMDMAGELFGYLGVELAGCSPLLDMGCGAGWFLRHHPGWVGEYIGIDISAEALRTHPARVRSQKSTLITASWEHRQYIAPVDGLLLSGVMYYQKDRRAFLADMLEWYQPKIVVIQDLVQTDLSAIAVDWTGKVKWKKIDLPEMAHASVTRRQRQILTIRVT